MQKQTKQTTRRDLPLALIAIEGQKVLKPDLPAAPHRFGDLCPVCQAARLDYDGLLNLTCPTCGFSVGGGCHT